MFLRWDGDMSLFINIPKESLSLEMLVAGKVKRRSKLEKKSLASPISIEQKRGYPDS